MQLVLRPADLDRLISLAKDEEDEMRAQLRRVRRESWAEWVRDGWKEKPGRISQYVRNQRAPMANPCTQNADGSWDV